MRSLKSMISFLDVCHLKHHLHQGQFDFFGQFFKTCMTTTTSSCFVLVLLCWEFCDAFDNDNIVLTAFLSQDLFSRRNFALLCCFLMTKKILKNISHFQTSLGLFLTHNLWYKYTKMIQGNCEELQFGVWSLSTC